MLVNKQFALWEYSEKKNNKIKFELHFARYPATFDSFFKIGDDIF